MGIGGGMVACFGQLSIRRQELLLYMAASILIVNSVNIVLSEWGYFMADLKKLLSTHHYEVLVHYGNEIIIIVQRIHMLFPAINILSYLTRHR